jgi:hypothetical protein
MVLNANSTLRLRRLPIPKDGFAGAFGRWSASSQTGSTGGLLLVSSIPVSIKRGHRSYARSIVSMIRRSRCGDFEKPILAPCLHLPPAAAFHTANARWGPMFRYAPRSWCLTYCVEQKKYGQNVEDRRPHLLGRPAAHHPNHRVARLRGAQFPACSHRRLESRHPLSA